MATQVIMPQLGESVVEGTINRWLKQEGDPIDEYEPLLEVGSDKVDTEIPSPAKGVVLKLLVAEGQTVTAGTPIAVIGAEGEALPDDLAGPQPAFEVEAGTGEARFGDGAEGRRPETDQAGVESAYRRGPRISPVVARIAAEHNVDLSRVPGTGREGRITKRDILAYIERGGAAAAADRGPAVPAWEQPGSGDLFKPTDDLYRGPQAAPAAPPVAPAPPDHVHTAPPAPGQPGEVVPLTRMRRLIAEHMVRSKLHTAPHVTTVFEADMGAISAHRQAHLADYRARGVNLTFTAYLVAAAAQALRLHPMVNSSWTDEGILLHRDVNIGMAAATDEGLIVPVIRRADELSLLGLSRQINDLAARARANQLKPDEVAGGTFTITNHGVSGSLFATPIIPQPQTAILGVGAIQKRVVVTPDDAIAIRPMAYLTLTFDHRVLDGAAADFFMADVVRLLQTWSVD
ncbi:MAG: dihydrolipoamide acetyltransferase family protein [Anaerolineae bacterium]